MALTTQLIGVNTVLGAFVAGILIGESPILTRHIDEQLRGLIVALFMPVFFGAVRAARRPHRPAPSRSCAARGRPHRHRQHRKIPRRLSRRQARRADARGIAGARLRHERARLDRGDRRLDRPVDGRAQPKSLHAHRHHGGGHHHGDADDAALGAQAAAAAQEGAAAARARGARRQGFCDQSRTPAACRRRQRQRQIRGAAGRRDRRLRRQADHDPRSGKRPPDKKIGKAKMEKPAEKSGKSPSGRHRGEDRTARDSEQQVKTAAEAATTLEAHPDEEKPGSVDVTTRPQESIDSEAVAGEARKGYDLLVVGIAKTRNPKGGFSKDVSLITKGFEGPLAIVDSHRSEHRSADRPLRQDPHSGERHGRVAPRRRGRAHFGARQRRASHGALCHAQRARRQRKSASRRRAIRRNERAVLKDIAALGRAL